MRMISEGPQLEVLLAYLEAHKPAGKVHGRLGVQPLLPDGTSSSGSCWKARGARQCAPASTGALTAP